MVSSPSVEAIVAVDVIPVERGMPAVTKIVRGRLVDQVHLV